MVADPLAGLRRALGQLAKVPAQASTEAAAGINRLLQREYSDGADPYGKPWAPLKPSTLAKGRSAPPLTATGRMRAGTKARPLPGGGISIEAPSPANFHQSGTKVMAKRAILPEKGLPVAWKAEIDKAVTASIKRTMSK